jgi:hypothetical protein
MRLDSQYGVCFRACLYRLIEILAEDKKNHKLHVVIENGHRNVGDAVRIFSEMKAEFAAIGFNILGTVTVAKKTECWPLMIADFQAHASHLSETRLKADQPGYFQMTRGVRPRRGEAALTQIEHSAESLRALKTTWEAEKTGAHRSMARGARR